MGLVVQWEGEWGMTCLGGLVLVWWVLLEGSGDS